MKSWNLNNQKQEQHTKIISINEQSIKVSFIAYLNFYKKREGSKNNIIKTFVKIFLFMVI